MRYAMWQCVAAMVLVLIGPALVRGQSGSINLRVDSRDLGIGGHVRPGTWTPLLVEIEYQTAATTTPPTVLVRWHLTDVDGDPVYVQRVRPLTPNDTTSVWLYGVPPLDTRVETTWNVYVYEVEVESDGELDVGKLLAEATISPQNFLKPDISAIGGITNSSMAIDRYEKDLTQQEEIRFIRNISLNRLPDQWYGYSLFQMMIWAPDGGDPSVGQIGRTAGPAIREWIRRGGHLVISLPIVGEQWTSSGMRDLFSDERGPLFTMTPVYGINPPMRLGRAGSNKIDALVLKPRFDADVSVLMRTGANTLADDPIVLSRQYGLGRVTFVGIDLSDTRIKGMGLPNSEHFWNDLTGWRSPAFSRGEIDKKVDKDEIRVQKSTRSLTRFVRSAIAMTGTFTTALTVAILVFGLYWLIAGPVSFLSLKSRGKARHSWAAFAATAIVFSGLSWGGAYLMRPSRNQIEHFSLIVADSTQPQVRVHSWMSLFVSDHGIIEVRVDPDRTEGNTSTIAAPGLPDAVAEGQFFDQQAYVLNAAAPHTAAFPFRSTSKQFEIDYHGIQSESTLDGMDAWIMPQGRVVDIGGLPSGKLSHELPGEMTNVLFIYCPGEGKEPWVTSVATWKPGEIIGLTPDVKNYTRAIEDIVAPSQPGDRWHGYLADRMSKQRTFFKEEDDLPGVKQPIVAPRDPEITVPVELLTFYNMLPTPEFWKESNTFEYRGVPHHVRPLGREFDRSALMQMRRLIVLGFIKDSPLPAPMTVDGRQLPSNGWTVVQWSTPVPKAEPPAAPSSDANADSDADRKAAP